LKPSHIALQARRDIKHHKTHNKELNLVSVSMITAVRTIIWVVWCGFFYHVFHVLPSSAGYLESAEKTKWSNIYYTFKIYNNFENQASS